MQNLMDKTSQLERVYKKEQEKTKNYENKLRKRGKIIKDVLKRLTQHNFANSIFPPEADIIEEALEEDENSETEYKNNPLTLELLSNELNSVICTANRRKNIHFFGQSYRKSPFNNNICTTNSLLTPPIYESVNIYIYNLM